MPHTQIKPLYDALTSRAKSNSLKDLKGDKASEALRNLIVASRGYLATAGKQALASKIEGKEYFMFFDEARRKTSRPVNQALYLDSLTAKQMDTVLNCVVTGMGSEELTKIIYTMAISYCCSSDLLHMRDQKTPGTFFEFLIGHIVSRALGVNPERQITVPTLGMNVTLPTDFVFDLGADKNRVHLPIKLSTRERVVQVWAHQRVLDGMHGVARFKGVLVAMAETNKQEDASVVEVCLPNQWAAYQMYIAQLFRVYYLDIPRPYLALRERYPFIQVKPIGDFFSEIDKVERSGVG